MNLIIAARIAQTTPLTYDQAQSIVYVARKLGEDPEALAREGLAIPGQNAVEWAWMCLRIRQVYKSTAEPGGG